MAAEIRSMGISVDSIPTASPVMMFVAEPVSEAEAMRRIGFSAV